MKSVDFFEMRMKSRLIFASLLVVGSGAAIAQAPPAPATRERINGARARELKGCSPPAPQIGAIWVTEANAMSRAVRRQFRHMNDPIEQIVAPASIKRAMSIFEQSKDRSESERVRARKIIHEHIYGPDAKGEIDEHRLVVAAWARLNELQRQTNK